jgi:formylmethanofuran dehydrogenase subunit B
MPPPPMTTADISNVTCPFCGLLCDDLVVNATGKQLTVRGNGCAIALPAFQRVAPADASAQIAGRAVSLTEAAAEAARLLRGARLPLIGGLATDVEGARAATRLADRTGAVLDHMNSPAAMRNTLVLQDGGWVTTTLSEIRNRADLFIAVGSDIVARFPRFFERCIANRETLFDGERKCEVIFLGKGLPKGVTLPGITAETIECDVSSLSEAIGVMQMLLSGRTVTATEAAGAPLVVWQRLATRMGAARYGVAAWAAVDFDFGHAELTVQALCELIKDLNRQTRFVGLPLSGSDGDFTADSVAMWQTGFGSRTSFGQGQPDHDSYHYSTARLLQDGGADVLVWISSFNEARTPPKTSIPTIVVARPGMAGEQEASVFIPVGTPGLDHAGHMFRADRVVALPLQRLRDSTLPSVADVIAAIEAAL